METDQTSIADLKLLIAPGSLPFFTTLLQAGIEIEGGTEQSIGVFLARLPGFTAEYIATTVQTIFLNGVATDNLETPLHGNPPVLAISAAMPGLAGAIFRKNSFHAALRTEHPLAAATTGSSRTKVTLKLFNVIARDCGSNLLRQGVTIASAHLRDFLISRASLLPHIRQTIFAGSPTDPADLLPRLADQQILHLIIDDYHDPLAAS